MDLYALRNHMVRFVFTDGEVIEGYVHTYISAYNNAPDPECVLIDYPRGGARGYLEITEEELKSATILD